MARADLIAGLDVGTTKVCAVIAELSPAGQPIILGVGISPCSGLKKGVVVDLDATAAAVSDAVEAAERMAGERVRSVTVGVTGAHISCLNSRNVVAVSRPGREISQGDVERVLDAARVVVLPPDREIIHAIPRWYAVDGQAGVRSPVGMHGSRLEVEAHIVTGLSSFIQNVVKCISTAGFAVDGTVLEPIAAGESVLLPAEKDLGAAVVDIGGGTTDLALYIDGEVFYSSAIPVGGNHLTRDIEVGLRCDAEEAERVKLRCGCVLPGAAADSEAFEVVSLGSPIPRKLPLRVLSEIIEPRMSEVFALVMREIEKAGCEGRLPAGLVLTGGGSLLPGIEELAARTTGLAARAGVPSGAYGLSDRLSSPGCATALGLILYCSRYRSGRTSQSAGASIVSEFIERIRELISRFI